MAADGTLPDLDGIEPGDSVFPVLPVGDSSQYLHNLRVRFGTETVTIPSISATATVADLISLLRAVDSSPCSEKLRSEIRQHVVILLFGGRKLLPAVPLHRYGLQNDVTLNAAISRRLVSGDPSESSFSFGVEDEGEGEVDGVIGGNESGVDADVLGFDRLAEQGVSEEDIEFARSTFYASRPHLLSALRLGQMSPVELRREEERWMNEEDERQGGVGGQQHETAPGANRDDVANVFQADDLVRSFHVPPRVASRLGTEWDVLFGVLIGFVFGLMTLFLFCYDFGTSRKFKYGVGMGVFVHVFLSIFELMVKM